MNFTALWGLLESLEHLNAVTGADLATFQAHQSTFWHIQPSIISPIKWPNKAFCDEKAIRHVFKLLGHYLIH